MPPQGVRDIPCNPLFRSFRFRRYEFKHRNLRGTVEPDRIHRPADAFRYEDGRPPGGGLQPTRVPFVSYRQDRRPDERNIDLSAVRVTRDHQVNPFRELGVGGVRVVGEDNPTFGIGDRAQEVVKRLMILPQISGTRYPELFASLLDYLHFMPKVLIRPMKPFLGSLGISPMVVVSEHGVNAEIRLQSCKKRPHRVNLAGRHILMYIVARARDQITVNIKDFYRIPEVYGPSFSLALFRLASLQAAPKRAPLYRWT